MTIPPKHEPRNRHHSLVADSILPWRHSERGLADHPQKDKLRNRGSLCSAGLAQDAIVGLNLHITRFLLLEFPLADERAMLGLEKLLRQAAVCNAKTCRFALQSDRAVFPLSPADSSVTARYPQ